MGTEKQIHINELLCYAIHHINNGTKENICKVINHFYTCEEICEAKKQLWSVEGTQSLGPIEERKKSVRRSASEANVDDILDALIKLDSEDCIPCFAAINVERLPQWQPEQLNIISIIDRLTNLEKELKDHDKLLILQSEIIDDMKKDIKDTKQSNPIVEVVKEHLINSKTVDNVINSEAESLSHQSEMNLNDEEGNSSEKEDINDVRTHEFICGDIVLKNKESTPMPVKDKIKNFEREIDKHTPRNEYTNNSSNQLVDKEGYILQESKSDKKRRLENISVPLRGAPPPMTSVFVGRLIEGDEKSIFRHLKNRNIKVQDISLISHKNSRYRSFKVSLYKNQLDDILNEKNWPQGILVKPWKDLRRHHNMSRQTTFFNTKHRNSINNNNNNSFRY